MFMQDVTRFAPVDAFPALPVTSGMAAGTPVETRAGWRAVESLRAGDEVHTFDGGLRRVAAVDRAWLLPGMQGALVAVPGGAFGNCADLLLLPEQHVLLDIEREEVAQGLAPDALAALIPASALEGSHGIRRKSVTQALQVVTLLFAEEELVWAASGVLLHCPAVARGAGSLPAGDIAPRLSAPLARRLLAARAQEATLPGWCA